MPVGDIDIATTARAAGGDAPRAVPRASRRVPTGIDHGTVTLVVAGRPFEVTTLREDVETFGRHGHGRASAATGSATPSGATSP